MSVQNATIVCARQFGLEAQLKIELGWLTARWQITGYIVGTDRVDMLQGLAASFLKWAGL
jgi:hypothetical protein